MAATTQACETKLLPTNLSQVISEGFPPDCLQLDVPFAIFTFFRVWLTCAVTFYLVTEAPWYLLPFAWILHGTAITGLFVVAHDCAHQSFSHSRSMNEFFGTICMMPLLFPYNCWEVTHNNHHTHTNNMDKDHLWRPLTDAELAKMPKWKRTLSYYMFGPLFFESSILHHAYHFLIPMISKKNRFGCFRSIIFAALGGYITITKIANIGSVFSLFLMPFLVFQFWLSTFTYFHHRHTSIPGWKYSDDWNKVYGSLLTTAHIDYPAWIEWLTLNINWHLPHHVSSNVPWYNLRKCTFTLTKKYGDHLTYDEFGWKLWKEVTTSCHMYDKEKGFSQWPANKSR